MQYVPRCRSAAGMAALLCLAAAPPDFVPKSPVPLAVHAGRCSFVLPAGRPGEKYILVVSSLSRGLPTHSVQVRTEATGDAVSLPLANDDPGPAWRRDTNALADQLDKARRIPVQAEDFPAAPDPP